MKKFDVHWLDGTTQRVEGLDIADALLRAGLSSGTISNLDYYSSVQANAFGDYIVENLDGSPVDLNAMYFVLRIDTDPHARVALRAYARSVRSSDSDLAKKLDEWIESRPAEHMAETSEETQ